MFTPKRDNKKQGYFAGCEMQRLKEFNPSSREHIAWWFTTFQGWKPTKLTPTGKAVIDETVLKEIGTEEAISISKYSGHSEKVRNVIPRN